MANDAYLKIEGINGESEDERHRNWIEVANVLYAVHQPRAGVVSTAGGHTTGRADLYPINFTKLADIASPVLLQTCATGKTIPKASFEFMRADGDGKPIPYFKIELQNFMIASMTPDSGEGAVIVTGSGINACGHTLLHVGESWSWYVHIAGPYKLPKWMPESHYTRYLKENGKREIRRWPIKLPNPKGAHDKLHELMQKPWLWGVVVHNCTSFAEDVVRAGGSDAVQYFNCPAAEPFA